jgi:type I restriction enzyme S subunit
MTPRVIPKEWQWQRLGDLIQRFDAGVSVNGGDRPAAPEEFGVLKISAITEGIFRPDENKVIELGELDRATLSPKPNRLVMSRANTPSLVGASAYIDRAYPSLFLSDKLWQLEPHDERTLSMRWLGCVLCSPSFRKRLSEIATGTSQSMKNISKESVSELILLVPPICEQEQIASLLERWDIAIEKSQQLIEAKERDLSHFRSLLLRQSERGSPTRLRSATDELTLRNETRLGREAIMAVTKHIGMRPMRGETIAANIERYKVVPPRAFAYNPMRLNIGSIAMSSFDNDVLVSPDYVVFACDESRLLPGYLNHLRRSQLWKSHFELAGNGSVRVRIYYDDLGRFSFRLPSLTEQAKIVKFLDGAEQEIALLHQQADALRKQKRGLMQKLLTGEWRLPLPEQEAV